MMSTMNRRELIKHVAFLIPLMKTPAMWASRKSPEIAFTFDDPKTDSGAGLSWQEINERMLAALAKHQIRAVLFVTGKRVDSDAGRTLVSAWDQAGHAIGNHSYSHLFFNNTNITLDQFESDFLRDEPLIRNYPHFPGGQAGADPFSRQILSGRRGLTLHSER
jgi:peptidoglycan/xylan/chitin deacetylase (PgdA/CDA1 family)